MAAYLYKKKLKYYLPREVAVHNKPDDIWVSIHRRVLNITEFIEEEMQNPASEIRILLAYAGKDISHWFTEDLELKQKVSIESGILIPLVTPGLFPHIPDKPCPTVEWKPPPHPWWKKEKYHIGWVTERVRHIIFLNMLLACYGYEECRHSLEVCCEENMFLIMERLFYANLHAGSYTWRSAVGYIDMYGTLDDNGILAEPFGEPPPTIFLYYNRDLTRDRYKSIREMEDLDNLAEEIIFDKDDLRDKAIQEDLENFYDEMGEDYDDLYYNMDDYQNVILPDNDEYVNVSKTGFLENIPEEPDAEAAAEAENLEAAKQAAEEVQPYVCKDIDNDIDT